MERNIVSKSDIVYEINLTQEGKIINLIDRYADNAVLTTLDWLIATKRLHTNKTSEEILNEFKSR